MIDAKSIERLREEFLYALAGTQSPADLETLRIHFLGRRAGVVTAALKQVPTALPEDRPELGRLLNELRADIEKALADKARRFGGKDALKGFRRARGLPDEPTAEETPAFRGFRDAGAKAHRPVDVTLPGRRPELGAYHPLSIVRRRIEDIFSSMGYAIVEGPEIEDDYHNFEALNMPPEHPARDAQDTLYLPGGLLLRTHTSAMQIRYMQQHQPPVRILVPGRVYRRDDFDATHLPMFHQFEGLVVDEGIALADLKGTLQALATAIFGEGTPVRFRASYFPYTEPSGELDIGCVICHGSGCRVCKNTGWLEILGCGMVHPAVFEAVGYDSERYTGFAFGAGIERIAILKYGVSDMRLFLENDLRFLSQFRGWR